MKSKGKEVIFGVLSFLLMVSLARVSDGDPVPNPDESVDPFEQQQISAGADGVTYSTYALEDTGISYDYVKKLDAASLFKKGADLSGGIRGVVQSGGSIDLQAYAYDAKEQTHRIYHVRLLEDSADDYSWSQAPTVRASPLGEGKERNISGNSIKTLLGTVGDPYKTTKEEHVRFARSLISATDSNREDRGIGHWIRHHKRAIFGATIGIGVAAVGVVLAPVTGGVSLSTTGMGLAMAAGAVGGAYVGSKLDFVANSRELTEQMHADHPPPPLPVPTAGTPQKQNFADVSDDHPLHPMGLYPVKVVVTVRNATFYSAKIPGIADTIDANYLVGINAYAPQALNWITATDYWSNYSHFNDGVQVAASPSSYPLDTGVLEFNSSLQVWLTVNPGTSAAVRHKVRHSSPPTRIDSKVGDHVLLEVVVPLASGASFDANNPDHYPRLAGFPYVWRAFFAGETLYQCEPSVQPGEWRPWLGYDSQVHGVNLRKYPNDFNPKFHPWEAQVVNNGRHVVYRWTAKLTRRMGVSKTT